MLFEPSPLSRSLSLSSLHSVLSSLMFVGLNQPQSSFVRTAGEISYDKNQISQKLKFRYNVQYKCTAT